MKMKQVLVLFVGLILISVSGIADAGEKIHVNVKVPLPDDIKITAPATDVPKEIAAFSGAWEGKCNHFDTEFYESPAYCDRYKGIVTPEKQQIKFSPIEKKQYTFSMENNLNQVKGTVKKPAGTGKIIMTKIK